MQSMIEWSNANWETIAICGVHENIGIVILLFQVLDFSHLRIKNLAAMLALLGLGLNLFATVLALLS